MWDIIAYADEVAADAATADGAQATGMGGGMGMLLIVYAVIFGAFWFFLIRPQKKQQQEAAKMLNSLRVNDEVITAGGIMGKITQIKEDSVVVETGSDKVRIRFEKSAIKSVLTVHDDGDDDEYEYIVEEPEKKSKKNKKDE